MTPAEVLARPQNLAQIEQRNAEWLAETPGGPPWTERQRGEGFFQAGYDRYVLLAALQEAQERVARLEAVYGAAVAFVDSGVLVHRNFWPLTQALHAAVEAADRHFQPAEQERGHFDLDRQGKPFVRHELPPAAVVEPKPLTDRGAKALAEREAAYWGWAPEFIDEETMDEMRALLGTTGLFIPDVTAHEPMSDGPMFIRCRCGWYAETHPTISYFDHLAP